MNGSDDEQHDAHVKCYRIAVAVADGDAVAAAYDSTSRRLVRPMSATQLIEPTSSASAARGKTRRRPLPLSFCLPPFESWRGTSPDPGREIASRPKHRRIRRRRHDRGRPQNPDARDGLNAPAHLVRAVLGYDLGLGSSGKRK
jgi:hypothetical protein